MKNKSHKARETIRIANDSGDRYDEFLLACLNIPVVGNERAALFLKGYAIEPSGTRLFYYKTKMPVAFHCSKVVVCSLGA